VRAASVNAWDWDLLSGQLLNRLEAPFRPKHRVLGSDVAGVIEAVGPNVTRWQPGDSVLGDVTDAGFGAFAEFVAAPEGLFVRKPDDMTFEQAAAIPQAGVLALLGLRANRPVETGQQVLINGAGGGVGSFAIQLARAVGATVTGVDAAEKLDLIRSLGAAHTLDYRKEDFTRTGVTYDLILDVVARRSVVDYQRALNPGGTAALIGGALRVFLAAAARGSGSAGNGWRSVQMVMWRSSAEDLKTLTQAIEAGSLKPVIDRVLPLEQASEALRLISEGRVQGKVVLNLAQA
jgi:NADPH:quinone reductase-like Zn-dependent oxidoreductase